MPQSGLIAFRHRSHLISMTSVKKEEGMVKWERARTTATRVDGELVPEQVTRLSFCPSSSVI
jgi:hypothetical protein